MNLAPNGSHANQHSIHGNMSISKLKTFSLTTTDDLILISTFWVWNYSCLELCDNLCFVLICFRFPWEVGLAIWVLGCALNSNFPWCWQHTANCSPLVQLPGASLESVVVSLTDFQIGYRRTNRKQTDSAVYRVASATKNYPPLSLVLTDQKYGFLP
jgi:hypothetical protein